MVIVRSSCLKYFSIIIILTHIFSFLDGWEAEVSLCNNLNKNDPEGTPPSKKVWKYLNRYFLWKEEVSGWRTKEGTQVEMGGGEDETETHGLKWV